MKTTDVRKNFDRIAEQCSGKSGFEVSLENDRFAIQTLLDCIQISKPDPGAIVDPTVTAMSMQIQPHGESYTLTVYLRIRGFMNPFFLTFELGKKAIPSISENMVNDMDHHHCAAIINYCEELYHEIFYGVDDQKPSYIEVPETKVSEMVYCEGDTKPLSDK